MQWGAQYQAFHIYAWKKVFKTLDSGGLFILNVKDHPRDKVLQGVPQWHRDRLHRIGFELLEDRHVPVLGMGFGQNQHGGDKCKYEHVMVWQKP